MDKHLTLSNLSVNAYLSPDKLYYSCLGITAALAVHRFWKTKYGTPENASTLNREDAYE